MIVVETGPSGPVQLLKASFAAVPTATGELPLCVPFGIEPDADDPGFLPLALQVTLTPRLLSMVLAVVAVYEPPPLTLAVSLVAFAAAGRRQGWCSCHADHRCRTGRGEQYGADPL